jgi:hypothetical protein
VFKGNNPKASEHKRGILDRNDMKYQLKDLQWIQEDRVQQERRGGRKLNRE